MTCSWKPGSPPTSEFKPQRKLNVACAGPAGRHDRLGDASCGPSRLFGKRSQVRGSAAERDAIGQREIGMVQDVEEFGAELHHAGCSEESQLGVLYQREVPVPERRPVQDVAPGIAQLTYVGRTTRQAGSVTIRRDREHGRVVPLLDV